MKTTKSGGKQRQKSTKLWQDIGEKAVQRIKGDAKCAAAKRNVAERLKNEDLVKHKDEQNNEIAE
jgi:hypothetical protein